MADFEFEQLLRDARLNAVLAWVITGVVALVAVGSFLTGDPLWSFFAVAVLVLVCIPPLAFFSPRVMLPWEVLLLAALPILGRAVATFDVSSQIATYLSVAALALIVAVELQTFTSVRMTPSFAVAFVVITTMAAAGIWAVARWSADIWLGTGFIEALGPDEAAQERAVMLEFVASFIAGILAGLIFEFYVRRVARVKSRLPAEVDR
ncbi:hypothetical protein [Salinibaculum salinum]|uniref:hypothetical protein n=1 Tax=Salinibaculum salinum TaxID=3131996 RepID=UPI0030EF84F4